MTRAPCGRAQWDICQPVRRQKAHSAGLKCFHNGVCTLSLGEHKEEKSPLNAERRQFSKLTNPHVETISLLWQSAHKTHPCSTLTCINEQESLAALKSISLIHVNLLHLQMLLPVKRDCCWQTTPPQQTERGEIPNSQVSCCTSRSLRSAACFENVLTR